VVKGKPWTVEEENELKQLLRAKRSARAIARIMGKSRECVSMKIARLGLEVVTSPNSSVTTTSCLNLPLPVELPSVEDQLKVIAAALKLMQTSGLGKDEVIRLRNVVKSAESYIDRYAQYLDYRGLEEKVERLIASFEKAGGLSFEAKDVAGKPETA